MTGIDLDAIVALDRHTHAEVSRRAGVDGLTPELREAAAGYFGERGLPTADAVAAY